MSKKVAFIGSGLIGTGFAVNALMNGWEAALRPRSQVEQAWKRVENGLDFFVSAGALTEAGKEEALRRLSVTTDLKEAVDGAEFIQEGVPERLELKQEMIAEIEELIPEDVVIASSTSGLLVTDIFAKAKHPERGVGGHPYHPAYLIPLVEIVKGEKTGEEYAQKAKNFYTAIGKEPVILNKEVVGYIANRFQSAVLREVIELVTSGVCSAEDADKAMTFGVGLRWAVMGQALTLHLGAAPEGIGGFNQKYNIKPDQVDGRMDALAKWSVYPKNWDKVLEKSVQEEMAARDSRTGNTMEEIEAWRDRTIVDILKIQRKI